MRTPLIAEPDTPKAWQRAKRPLSQPSPQRLCIREGVLPSPQVEERRATSRYNLALLVEIRLAPILTALGSILAKTRDISTHGFYFNIAQIFTVGTTFEFSIVLAIEITGATQAYISGTARAVRVEETGESHSGWSGVGAIIESYQVSRGKSVKP